MFLLLLLPCLVLGGEDYYKLLGITKNADNREIRKAFKKLALTLHPDKNDAEDAHEKFLKINRAYEVLKDEEKRKKYDMFGDEDSGGSSSRGSSYQSWQYYHSDFGLYDEDDSIVTLDYREFQQTVLQGHSLWFINYYSPRCGHCHDLAPEWRALARHLEGTGVRVGAVNCQEEPSLCRSQGVTGYPSLLLYTQDQGTKKFQGRREQEELLDYLLQHMEDRAVTLWTGNFKHWSGRESGAWLVLLCEDRQEGCTSLAARSLAAASLEGLARVGVVECREDRQLCDSLQGEAREGSRALYFPKGLGEEGRQGGLELEAAMDDHKEISAEVLAHLPELILLDGVAFQEMRRRLDQDVGPACLVQFLHGLDGQSQEYKKLLPQLPRVRVARVDCSSSHPICDDLHISRFPTFVMFKVGGAMEVHYGKPSLQEVGQFGRLSSQARTMETLAAADFPQILSAGGGVFIDFFAPWCPPCMSLLPEFRKASTFIGGQITFGTVDCTIHGRVCQQHGIRAYPTTVFFNGTKPHKYSGGHRARELADFVEDTLRPAVVELTGRSFHQLVGAKTEEDVWMVDFFAPWCGPCQQLAPEWRQLAKLTLHNPRVHVAKVDCTVEQGLCSQQGVDSYPTVRMYPRGSLGSSRYQPDTRQRRDSASLHSWLLEQLPSSVENITPYLFQHGVLASKQLWLVEFYTPWCGHCTHFAPQYDQVGLALQGKAKVGKINCEKYKQLCKQAEVSSYPTLRIYRGADTATDFEEVEERDVPGILALVEGKLEEKEKERGGHDEL